MKTRAERATLHNSSRPAKRTTQASKSLNGSNFNINPIAGSVQSVNVEGQEYFIPMESEKPKTSINSLNDKVDIIIETVERTITEGADIGD